jgi:chaperonin cofactor prefoldin
MATETESITSIDQFAAALEAADEPEQQDDENAQPEAEAQSGEPDAPAEQEEEQAEPVESEGDQPETESLDDKVVAWETASGEKFEVPVAEMKLGYMREQDYRHKTQTFAQEREQTVQHIQQQFQAAQTYAQDLGVLHAVNSQIAALEQAIPMMDKHGDPVSYMEARDHLNSLKESRTDVTSRVQQLDQQRQAETQAQLQQAQQRMFADLQTTIPGFNSEMVTKISTTAQGYGFTQQELQAISDPRFVRLVHDAMQLKALQAKAPGAVNKVKAAPIKPVKASTTAAPTGVEQQVKAFGKNKSLANFAALYKSTL